MPQLGFLHDHKIHTCTAGGLCSSSGPGEHNPDESHDTPEWPPDQSLTYTSTLGGYGAVAVLRLTHQALCVEPLETDILVAQIQGK
eukprot:7375812-Karenia_brevis.AAC.1